jgi:hypothetical protein
LRKSGYYYAAEGTGVGAGVGVAVAPGLGEDTGKGVGVGVGVGVALGVGVGVGLISVGDTGVAVGVGLGVGVKSGVGETVGDGVGEGLCAKALRVETKQPAIARSSRQDAAVTAKKSGVLSRGTRITKVDASQCKAVGLHDLRRFSTNVTIEP